MDLARYARWESPPLLVAEAGVNHGGDLDTALRMVQAAARAGAGVIKFQTYKAARLVTRTGGAYWDREQEPTGTQFELFSKYDRFDEPEYTTLAEECRRVGIAFSTSPFDVESVDWLEPLVEVFKVASGDITNVPLLHRVAETGKPVLLSTGGSTVGEIEEALGHLEQHGAGEVALLQCTLAYPTAVEDASVGALRHLASAFPGHVLGYSDHTVPPDSYRVIAAAFALGARVIETHFTLDRSLPGNDHYHAFDPEGLARLVKELEATRTILGEPVKRVLEVELPARVGARRSLVARVDIPRGTPLARELLDVKRPGGGVPPRLYEEPGDWVAAVDIPEDTTIEWHMLARNGD